MILLNAQNKVLFYNSFSSMQANFKNSVVLVPLNLCLYSYCKFPLNWEDVPLQMKLKYLVGQLSV